MMPKGFASVEAALLHPSGPQRPGQRAEGKASERLRDSSVKHTCFLPFKALSCFAFVKTHFSKGGTGGPHSRGPVGQQLQTSLYGSQRLPLRLWRLQPWEGSIVTPRSRENSYYRV